MSSNRASSCPLAVSSDAMVLRIERTRNSRAESGEKVRAKSFCFRPRQIAHDPLLHGSESPTLQYSRRASSLIYLVTERTCFSKMAENVPARETSLTIARENSETVIAFRPRKHNRTTKLLLTGVLRADQSQLQGRGEGKISFGRAANFMSYRSQTYSPTCPVPPSPTQRRTTGITAT